MFRPLHYLFRLGNRKDIKAFYVDILGMKVLRHEEFEGLCEAACNGPYDGKWSKTMVGYGEEDHHVLVELTYNYGISSYNISNDFKYIKINSTKVLQKVKHTGYGNMKIICDNPETVSFTSPDGYHYVVEGDSVSHGEQLSEVCIAVANVMETANYYVTMLHGTVVAHTDHSSVIRFGDNPFQLCLSHFDGHIVKTNASGRIVLSYQGQVSDIEKRVRDNGWKVQTSMVTLDTPGKASVDVVILLDPNEHEIGVVGDQGFRELSKSDPHAAQLLDEAVKHE